MKTLFSFSLLILLSAPTFIQAANGQEVNPIETKDTPAQLENFIEEFQPEKSHNKLRDPYRNAIPSKTWRAYDPINKDWYKKSIVGKTYKSSNPFANYHYWRHITVYNVFSDTEQLSYLPWYEEQCFESSYRMASWQETRSFKVSLSSTVGAEGLGLKASVSMSIESGVSFSTTRNIMATKGVQARHYPYKYAEEWEGVTYIQTYNKTTKKYGYLAKSATEQIFGGYPYEFYLDNQNMGFQIKREIIKKCDEYQEGSDNTLEMDMYGKFFD